MRGEHASTIALLVIQRSTSKDQLAVRVRIERWVRPSVEISCWNDIHMCREKKWLERGIFSLNRIHERVFGEFSQANEIRMVRNEPMVMALDEVSTLLNLAEILMVLVVRDGLKA